MASELRHLTALMTTDIEHRSRLSLHGGFGFAISIRDAPRLATPLRPAMVTRVAGPVVACVRFRVRVSPALTLEQKADLEFAYIDVLARRWDRRHNYRIPNLEPYVEAHP
jgi:hypothetical protein